MSVLGDGSVLFDGGVGRALQIGRLLPDGRFDSGFGDEGRTNLYIRDGAPHST